MSPGLVDLQLMQLQLAVVLDTLHHLWHRDSLQLSPAAVLQCAHVGNLPGALPLTAIRKELLCEDPCIAVMCRGLLQLSQAAVLPLCFRFS